MEKTRETRETLQESSFQATTDDHIPSPKKREGWKMKEKFFLNPKSK
jgi:hypothetical protein